MVRNIIPENLKEEDISLDDYGKAMKDLIQPEYDIIKDHQSRTYWITFNPDPRQLKSIKLEKQHRQLIDEYLIKLRHCAEEVIIVAEVKNAKLHYHILMLTHNARYLYSTIFSWKRYNNILMVKGLPAHGINYLCKDVKESYEILNTIPIILKEDLIQRNNIIKQQRKLITLPRTQNSIDLPKWMMGGGECSLHP